MNHQRTGREINLKKIMFIFDPWKSKKKIRGRPRSSVRGHDFILGENQKSPAELESQHAILKCAGWFCAHVNFFWTIYKLYY